MTNDLKARLEAGRPALGAWLELGSATAAELLAFAGYPFLVLDQEHGPGDLAGLVATLRAVQGSGCELVLRVAGNDPLLLKRALDAGARSIMVPMVESAVEARAVVEACRYPPNGRRGYAAPAVRASRYGLERDYPARADDGLLLIAQIESAAAAEQAEAIAAVDGIDIVFIGTNDLAGSMGRLERLGDPEVQAVVAKVERAVLGSGKTLGGIPIPGRDPAALVADGYRFVAGSADVGLLRESALVEIERWRKAFEEG